MMRVSKRRILEIGVVVGGLVALGALFTLVVFEFTRFL